MGDIWNIAFTIIFTGISIYLIYAFFKTRKLIVIPDQSFSFFRMMFFVLGLFSLLTFVNSKNTTLDYIRFAVTISCVTLLLSVHNGLCEEGVVAGLRFYKWNKLRGWDYVKNKNNMDIFLQLDSANEKKPDEYSTKCVTFSKNNMDLALKFMNLNARGKHMRMKKNTK